MQGRQGPPQECKAGRGSQGVQGRQEPRGVQGRQGPLRGARQAGAPRGGRAGRGPPRGAGQAGTLPGVQGRQGPLQGRRAGRDLPKVAGQEGASPEVPHGLQRKEGPPGEGFMAGRGSPCQVTGHAVFPSGVLAWGLPRFQGRQVLPVGAVQEGATVTLYSTAGMGY